MSNPPKTIVVAENDDLVRLLVIDLLTEAGFLVIPALHAAEAMATFEAKAAAVHMLFTDIHMPGVMSGLDLAHHVHGHWPWVALVLASGEYFPTQSDLPTGSRFLRKPYDPDRVVAHAVEMMAA